MCRTRLRGHKLALNWCKIRKPHDAIAAADTFVEVQDVNLNHDSMIQR